MGVSTHSRPKAAGSELPDVPDSPFGFNTQPPEGGWPATWRTSPKAKSFNTQPPEGGWTPKILDSCAAQSFQHTAARRRLAVPRTPRLARPSSFNTQPPEGGWDCQFRRDVAVGLVSTHSRPKAAGGAERLAEMAKVVSTHSRPKAAGPYIDTGIYD